MTAAALRSAERYVYQYRRTWRGSVFGTFVVPLLYLAAMGYGVGSLIAANRGATARLGGQSYLQFLGPGLLAAAGMLTALSMCTYQVLGSFRWDKVYEGMAASPLDVPAIVGGHLIWVAVRVAATAAAYVLAMAMFGVVRSWWVLLAIPAGTLTGLAFAAPVTAYSAWLDSDAGLAMLYRFFTVPMFLFSGTFFPVDQLPAALRPFAWLTPLWHGVDLARELTVGKPSAGSIALHAGYLCLWAAVGWRLALTRFRRRLAV